jgi:hypothetical protein
MAKQDRTKLIQNLQKVRNSKVVCYVTGDRPSFGMGVPTLATQIGSDAVRYFRDILEELQA